MRQKRKILLAVLMAVLVLIWLLAGQQGQLLSWLARHQAMLATFVAEHYALALAGYGLLYLLATALSFPGASILTLTGGWLFGVVGGSIATIIGATIGATIVFLIARFFWHQQSAPSRLLEKPLAQKMIAEFNHHGFSWLLVMRLVPIFPFWFVNIVPAATAMPLRTYIWATFIGIIPGSVVYVAAGNGLGALITQPGQISASLFWQAEIILPLLGLAVLALVPVLYQRWRQKHDHSEI